MSKEQQYNVNGIGFCGILTIVFIVLKLVGTISWSWWWILSPIWIPWMIVLAILLVVGIVYGILSIAEVIIKRNVIKKYTKEDQEK